MKDSIKPFPTHHEDIVLDVEYDFYGRQLATCSADKHIKVFDLDPATSSWVLNDSWKAHDSTIVKVGFANPEFGHLLLSGSYDRTLKIWEENFDEPLGSGRRWSRLVTIADSHGPLYDCCFVPSFLGLKVGSIGSDGKLRIYESMDPADLRDWTLLEEIDVLKAPVAAHLQSDFNVCWCPSRFSCEKFCVSALDQAYIYYKNENTNKFKLGELLPEHNGLIRSVAWAPLMGKSYHLIATACKDGYVRIMKVVEHVHGPGDISFTVSLISSFNEHVGEVWRVSWNMTGTILSSCGDDGLVRLYKSNYANNFQCMSVISAEGK
ncbi:DEKNAAC103089 [Brettanomyces naardenensis]|uniref:DEKNAAC103089 n=1 Tax=Brettanomyces naardenensis TaxID=13370 RepID=A0A448YMH1_BRENA|nr:DEKNAAC103089 [Brettanomyces naardenensis]